MFPTDLMRISSSRRVAWGAGEDEKDLAPATWRRAARPKTADISVGA